MRRELHTKPRAAKKPRRPAPEPKDIPLAHDAATWDEDTFESDWDDDEARLTGELTPDTDD